MKGVNNVPYWMEDDTDNKLGYNKDDDGLVTKYSRLTNYYDENGGKNTNHGHEVLDTATGTMGYRGENASKSDFRTDFDSMKFSK